MKPHVICHMVASIDGRILPKRWRPQEVSATTAYERIHDQLEGDAWLVGRVTGQEFAKAKTYPEATDQTFAREPWLAIKHAGVWAIVLDAHGKIAWGRSDIGGDRIVVVLTASVSDAHLAGLRADGVSYIFAGDGALDLTAALETLNRELGVKRILVEGGGVTNGSFLRAGLVDELSLIVMPVVDGANGAPSVFHSGEADIDVSAPVKAMDLIWHETLEQGAVWLRYGLKST
jgi:riboflavin biosynthesis pyrimidine reductase